MCLAREEASKQKTDINNKYTMVTTRRKQVRYSNFMQYTSRSSWVLIRRESARPHAHQNAQGLTGRE